MRLSPKNEKAKERADKLHNWLKRNKNNSPRPPAPDLLKLHLCFEDCYQLEDGKVVVLIEAAHMTPAEVRWLLKGCKQLDFEVAW